MFSPVLYTILYQLKNRFEGLRTLLNYFEFLSPLEIIKNNEGYIRKSSYDFITFYKDDVLTDFLR